MFLTDQAIRWLIFLINPFIAMLISFKEYTLPYAKNIFWVFCIFYGLTFAIAEEAGLSDINRYVAELQFLYAKQTMTINEIINYFQLSGEIDVLRTLIAYLLSRFTDSQFIMTMVFGTIFGFFYSRNIWYVFNLLQGKISGLEKLILITLILIIPIWQINGFRMWTAFHVFFYGLLPFIFENKKSKLIFVYLSFIVHFSYIIPISLVIFYMAFGNRIKIYFSIFIISLFISEVNLSAVNNLVENFSPQILVERSASYRNEDIIEMKMDSLSNRNANWYIKWKLKSLKWAVYILLIFMYIRGNRHIKYDNIWRKLFSITLLFFSVANILSNIPSGGRFIPHALFLALLMSVLYLNEFYKDIKFKRLLTLLSPSFLLFIIVSIRTGLYFTSITTILGNPFIALFNVGETLSLNDLIK